MSDKPHTDPEKEPDKPMTRSDRIWGVIIGLALIAFGIATWIWPELLAGMEQPSGRGSRKLYFWLTILWNRPAGSIGILVGIVALLGSLKKDAPAQHDGSSHSLHDRSTGSNA